ncbi:MAG: chorismate synthase [Aquificota bacterium]|jgi:chorismate synthase
MSLQRLRFLTAGESHGKGLVAILEGIPANLEISTEYINRELARRQKGYGRGGRMKIEKDKVEIISGIRFGKTLGSPISLIIWNRDYENWKNRMAVEGQPPEGYKPFTKPRPGHADLAGGIKYNQRDLRNILERSSARETAARVAVGAICKRFLEEFGIKIGSYVRVLGGYSVKEMPLDLWSRHLKAEQSEVRIPNPLEDAFVKNIIDKAKEKGETLGGIIEVFALNVPPGLGSHIQWDKRLDGRIAQAIMSIQAIKAVEIGIGTQAGFLPGSKVMDEIGWKEEKGYFRYTNRLGGLEGGITNGMPIVVRATMKPIPTLMSPLRSVDIETKQEALAMKERSDVTAVPAASVVAEAMLAIVLADALLEKLGGDYMEEIKERFELYMKHTKEF